MSRRPTLPSVSWSTGADQKEDLSPIQEEEQKKEEQKTKPTHIIKEEDFHAFDLDLELTPPPQKEPLVRTTERKRKGMSLAEYKASYNCFVCSTNK